MEIQSNGAAYALGAQSPMGPDTSMGRDAFMQLLIAQLRNQDPGDPMDTRDMMTQLVQLTSVEHLVGIEDRLTSLQIASAGMANAQVAGFVGQTVEADTSRLRLDEISSVQGSFELGGAAETVTVKVRDAEGNVVRTMELGAQGAGARSFTWDGRDDSGTRLEPGTYRVEVSAADADGNPVEARTRIRGVVTGVSYEHGYPELLIGEQRVLMGDVREVSRPGAASESEVPR
jgi:flagellar basal-body rod modification protein FlgD